ncbi:hypothetical protein OY671_003333, partial [Metschnikowia pulcherrima]
WVYVLTPPTEPLKSPIPIDPEVALEVASEYVDMNDCTQIDWTVAKAPPVVIVTHTVVGSTELEDDADDDEEEVVVVAAKPSEKRM